MRKGHGTVRRSQLITTWGPGALIDLPRSAGIVGGLETWPSVGDLDEIVDKRLSLKLAMMTGLVSPRLYSPPADASAPWERALGVGVWRFPGWFVVQEKTPREGNKRARRLVNTKALDEKKRFDQLDVVPIRFVRACPKGHIADINWIRFAHGGTTECRQQLWLDETGSSGDLGDLAVRCECGNSRHLTEAADFESRPLGTCPGAQPWLGGQVREECKLPARLLTRTAANAYFPQVLSALSLPDAQTGLAKVVSDLWVFLDTVENSAELTFAKKKPRIADKLANYPDEDVLAAISTMKSGGTAERPVKQVELDAVLAAPEGFGDDVPVDPDFHARRLPKQYWHKSDLCDPIEAVIQLHRLREVMALTGFTRFKTPSGSRRLKTAARESSCFSGRRQWPTGSPKTR